ncbi:ferrochelatase [Brevibacterium sp. 50QC2O2]|uniref:ferrochelatase n=1 Tax=Brevibacterium TaxID=1696 RepID=UPI00211C1551|nr:ferrochelatase [Brevibacterium sp. 68QC2CO]MCQ9389352.1 ferrochelatase [Brevibacterium sp. 50QC2O2]
MISLVSNASPASSDGAAYASTPQRYDGLLLAGFGGPEGQDDVIPFLRNVTRGRGIPDERLEVVARHYRHFGGISPINEQNRRLRAALEAELAQRGIDLPVYWGNRNWEPYLSDALRQAAEAGHTRLLAFATSAYSSFSSCRQYREDFAMALEETGLDDTISIDKIRQFFDHPAFVEAFAQDLCRTLRDFLADGLDATSIRVLFTTHSIPTADALCSGPRDREFGPEGAYGAQHRAVAAAVMANVVDKDPRLSEIAWELVFQSRSGPASQPWLEPDICDRIAELPAESVSAIAICPIGFVSDHMEVMWDLDTEAREAAAACGVRAVRTATPGAAPGFVAGIVDLIEERMSALEPDRRPAVTALGPWFDVCRPGCCENKRAGFKPAVAGLAP